MHLYRALLQIAFCCPMTQEKKVLWYWESSKRKTEPTQNCTTGDLAWNYQMRYELACNSIQETICSQKQEASARTHTVVFSNTPQEPWKHCLASHVRLLYWDIHTSHTCLHMGNSASRTRRSLPETCVIQLRHKLSTNSFHINEKGLSHRQAWSQFVHDWELNWTSRNQQLIDQHSRLKNCRWLGLEVNIEKSASPWEWLKTRENVNDWDLDVVMRNQQLIEHYSTLRNLSMIMLEIIVERSATQWSSLTQNSSSLSMVMLELVFERSATHWSPLKTQVKMSMIGTWPHLW